LLAVETAGTVHAKPVLVREVENVALRDSGRLFVTDLVDDQNGPAVLFHERHLRRFAGSTREI
jgi:hypothetical protein